FSFAPTKAAEGGKQLFGRRKRGLTDDTVAPLGMEIRPARLKKPAQTGICRKLRRLLLSMVGMGAFYAVQPPADELIHEGKSPLGGEFDAPGMRQYRDAARGVDDVDRVLRGGTPDERMTGFARLERRSIQIAFVAAQPLGKRRDDVH